MNSHVVSEDQFNEVFDKLIAHKTSFLAYFHGGYDEEGKSWCSDCDVASPNINAIIQNFPNIQLYKFPIVERLEWKKTDYKYRTHPKTNLSRVPTLIYYEKGIEFARLIEDELFNLDDVLEFVKQI
jgi:hypothetical protein